MSVNKPEEGDGGVGVFLQFDLEGEAGDPGHLEVGQGGHRPPDDLLEADLPVQTPTQVLLGGGVQEVVQVDGFGSLEDTVVFRELHPSQGEWESVGHEVPVHVVAVGVKVDRVGELFGTALDVPHEPVASQVEDLVVVAVSIPVLGAQVDVRVVSLVNRAPEG